MTLGGLASALVGLMGSGDSDDKRPSTTNPGFEDESPAGSDTEDGSSDEEDGNRGGKEKKARKKRRNTARQSKTQAAAAAFDRSRIHVYVRIRPLLHRELSGHVCVSVKSEASLKVFSDKSALESACDYVWEETCTQKECFNAVRDSVPSLLKGFNNTVFVYGQTGTGKTYTMLGGNYIGQPDKAAGCTAEDEIRDAQSDSAGIIPRMMLELFDAIGATQGSTAKKHGLSNYVQKPADSVSSTKVFVSYLEVYNEKVYDLLNSATKNTRGDAKDLKQTRIALEVRDTHVHGLTQVQVHSAVEVMSLVRKGNRIRAVRHTNMNAHSSRSHSIVQVTVHQTKGSKSMKAKLNLVDLAGSERWDESDKSAARVQEMTSINQGLSALASVVAALQVQMTRRIRDHHGLAEGPAPPPVHIPYRDSKLTHLLMDSLGGNCRTVMIAAISPSSMSAEENMSTLRFADRVRAIRNRAKAVESHDPAALLEAKEAEILRLKALLNVLAGGDAETVSSMKDNLEMLNRELDASRKELARAKRVLEDERVARLELERTLTLHSEQGARAGSLGDQSPMSDHSKASDAAHLPDIHSPPGRTPSSSAQSSHAVNDVTAGFYTSADSLPGINPKGALANMLHSQGLHVPERVAAPSPVPDDIHALELPRTASKDGLSRTASRASLEPSGGSSSAAADLAPHSPQQPPAGEANIHQHSDGGVRPPGPVSLDPSSPDPLPISEHVEACPFIAPAAASNEQQPPREASSTASTEPHAPTSKAPSLSSPRQRGDSPAVASSSAPLAGAGGGISPPSLTTTPAASPPHGGSAIAVTSDSGKPSDRQLQRGKKEFIAVGGILAEIGQIRSDLRGIINANRPPKGRASDQAYYRGTASLSPPHYYHRQEGAPSSVAYMSYPPGASTYPPRGSPRHADSGLPSHQGGQQPPYGGQPKSQRQRVSARGQHGTAQQAAHGQMRPAGGRQDARQQSARGPTTEAVYFSPAIHNAALGVQPPPAAASAATSAAGHGNPHWGRSAISAASPMPTLPPTVDSTQAYIRIAQPPPVGMQMPPIASAKQQPAAYGRSSLVSTGKQPSGYARPAHKAAHGRVASARKPLAGAPMDKGTWMYLLGPHYSSARAARIAEIDAVAGLDMTSAASPAYVLLH